MKKINKKDIWSKVIVLPLLLLIGAILGTIILTIGFAIPVNQSRAAETFTTIAGQSSYHSVLDMRNCSYFFSSLSGVLDTATDGLMFQTALYDSEGSYLFQAMDMKGYSYYWHGYVAILRALTLLFNYSEIRFLNFVLQFLLVLFFTKYLYEKKGGKYGMLFLSSYLLLMPMALYYCLQFSWIFYIAIGASFLLIKNINFFEEKGRYLYLFVAIGLITCFFDLLTYPLISWAYPVLWWILCCEKEKKPMEYLRDVVASGFAWIFGYGGMWVLKCVIGSWVLKRNVLQTAIDEVFIRVGATEQVTWSSRFDAIKLNLAHYADKLYLILFVIWIGWFIYKVMTAKTVRATKIPALILVASSSIVWYFVLTNHTSVHHFFTYRIFNISILALLGCMVVVTSKGAKIKLWSKEMWIRSIHILIVCALAFGLTFFSREDVTMDNLNRFYQDEYILKEGQTVSMNFVPKMKYATEFGIQFEPLTQDGSVVFELVKDNKVVDTREIPFSAFEEELLHYFNVDWFLNSKEYTISLTVAGEKAEGKIYLGYGGPALLEGSDFAKADGKELTGQLLVGTVYSQRALPQGTQFVYVYLTWLFVVLPLYFSVLKEKERVNQ